MLTELEKYNHRVSKYIERKLKNPRIMSENSNALCQVLCEIEHNIPFFLTSPRIYISLYVYIHIYIHGCARSELPERFERENCD